MELCRVRLSTQDQMALGKSAGGFSGGFQSLFIRLQADWNAAGRGDVLPVRDEATAEKMYRYAEDYGGGGWQGRLRRWLPQIPRPRQQPTTGSLFGDEDQA
jgi:hypothetical protein